MSADPHLSVVMSVFNGADLLYKTIECVVNQSYRDFEFIIINDGSTDNSLDILQKCADQDNRIIILDQHNQGLTSSLITGCERAKGKYIARQDVGDYSFPTRLEKQVNCFQSHPNLVAVFCQFQVVDENGVVISQHQPETDDIKSVLDYSDGDIAAPSHHGSAMFSKTAYFQAGGYRQEFRFAQDLDLWVRMKTLGDIKVIDEILYQALLSSNTISGMHHRAQKKYHNIIIESARVRSHNGDEQPILRQASAIKPSTNKFILNADKSSTLYFMGSCLLLKQPQLGKAYLRKALAKNPLNLKAWYKLLNAPKG